MTVEQIGEIAGRIWQYLSDNGETSVAVLKKKLEIKGELAPLGLGWLAREEKIAFEKKGNSIKVALLNK